MYKKFILPIQFFLVLEKNPIIYFFSKNSNFKTLYFLINKNWIFLLANLFKKELFMFNSSLIEASANDLTLYNSLNFNFFKKNKFIIFYNFFNYKNSIHYMLFYFTNNFKKNFSLDTIYKNSNWLERELSEMYGINFIFKNDTRKLLLDYSKKENPMLKSFPCEGVIDVYYNFFDSQIGFFKNEIIEL